MSNTSIVGVDSICRGRILNKRRVLGAERMKYRKELVNLLRIYHRDWYGDMVEDELVEEDWGTVESDKELESELRGFPNSIKSVDDDEQAYAHSDPEESTYPVINPPDVVFAHKSRNHKGKHKQENSPPRRKRTGRDLISMPALFGLPPVTFDSSVSKVETSHPWGYFYRNIKANFLTSLIRGVQFQGQPLYLNLKELILDGTQTDEASVESCLVNCTHLEGISVRGVNTIKLWFWVRWLELRFGTGTRYQGWKEKRPSVNLKWIRMFPSGDLPTGRCNTHAYRRPNIEDETGDPFLTNVSIQEHDTISLPMLVPVSPAIAPPRNYIKWLVNYALLRSDVDMSFRNWLDSADSAQGVPWNGGRWLRDRGLIQRLLVMAEIAGIDLDWGYCASGENCFAFRHDPERTVGVLNRHANECSTHTVAGKMMRKERGGKKCKGCGVWEWEIEGRPNTCADERYRENREKYAGQLVFGKTVPEQDVAKHMLMMAENAMCEVAGVRIAKIVGKKNGISVPLEKVAQGTEDENLIEPEGDEYIGIGVGAGSVCEICEMNMTCWDCGEYVLPSPLSLSLS